MINRDASDEQLAVLAQQGDKDAFMALYNRYLAKVFNRVKSRVPPQDAEDVTQEAFVAMVRSLPKFERRAKFNTWLYTIVNRQIADYYRRRGKGGNPGGEVSLEDVEHTARAGLYETDSLGERGLIQKALHTLPEHYQEIIMLRFADGLSFQEIADERGQTLDAVKSLYRRAIEALRDQVGGTIH